MAQQIIDFDVHAPADKLVRISGKVYPLPGDIPAELWVHVQRLEEEQNHATETGVPVDNTTLLLTLHDQILELFQHGDPEIDALPAGLSLTQMVGFIGRVYGEQPDEDDSAARPTRRTASPAGTRSSSAQRPRRKSR